MKARVIISVFLLTGLLACGFPEAAEPPARREIPTAVFQALKPLHALKSRPGPYDWLATHPEPGQTYEQFVQSQPPSPGVEYGTFIDLILLGDFDPPRRRIVEQAVRFIEAFYQMPVRMGEEIPLSAVPPEARRVHPQTGDRQILSTWVIDELLVPRRREGAFTTIAFTSSDLWPGAGWNFVFGQASLDDRVGVWSIYRNGDPSDGDEARRLCLMRTAKTGTHELGHMFGLHHCIYFECLLNGSNHRKESDSRPLWLCPVDLRKLAWSQGWNPGPRFQELESVSRELGFDGAETYYREAGKIMEDIEVK